MYNFKECNAILTLPNEGTVTEETMCYDHPPVLTCVEDLCEMVGYDIKHELEAQMKIEGMLNYLQKCGVIEEYNADRLDYVFGNDEPY